MRSNFVNPISSGVFGPCILPLWGIPCHKFNLSDAVMMKFGQLVDQVKWGLMAYSLLPEHL